MFDGEGLGQAKHQSALQMGAGGLLRTTSKDNIVLIQAVETVRSVTGWDRVMAGYLPNIEVFGVICATEKAESHDGGHSCEGGSYLTNVTNSKSEGIWREDGDEGKKQETKRDEKI